MNRFGGVSDDGAERRKVVEVPKERIASPGRENETRVAGLSPVNDPTMHSVNNDQRIVVEMDAKYRPTWIETPSSHPPIRDLPERKFRRDGFWT